MDPNNGTQFLSQQSCVNTSTRRYYVYAGATFPCNGDDSPIDRNNYVSFPCTTGSSCLRKGDSCHGQSLAISPSPLPSPSSSILVTCPQDRGWIGGEHRSPLRNSPSLDELLDSSSSDVDTAEFVSASTKEASSSISSSDYQDKNCAPIVTLRPTFVEETQHEKRACSKYNTETESSVSAAYTPANTRSLHPRHQTKDRFQGTQDSCPSSARSIILDSVIPTRPAPPVRRFSFRKATCHSSSIDLNESGATRYDRHLDWKLNQRSQTQSQPPKKMSAPRSRPSVFGAFSYSPSNLTSSSLVVDDVSRYRNGGDTSNRRASEATWHSTSACTGTISSCVANCGQANDLVLCPPLYDWTQTPEPKTSSIMGNYTYSSSSPCLPTSIAASAVAASASASTIPLLLRAQKPSRRFSFNWFSKNQLPNSSALSLSTSSLLDITVGDLELQCTCTEQGHCRFHKDLPGLPDFSTASREDTVLKSKHRFSRLRQRNHYKGSKLKPNRMSILSTAALRTLVQGSHEEQGKSVSTSRTSKLQLKKGSKRDLTIAASSATSDTATTSTRRSSHIGGFREMRASTVQMNQEAFAMSAPTVVPELQKPPKRLIPNVIRRMFDRRAGHADHSGSGSMMFEWDEHSDVGGSTSAAHSTIAAPAASAMPKLGIQKYNPAMCTSSPCLSITTKAPRSAQQVCQSSAIAFAPRRYRPAMVTGPNLATPSLVPLQGHHSVHDECGLSRTGADLVPKQAATSYEKEKMSFFEPFRMKHRNPGYISFHFDISHLEDDQRLGQGVSRTGECQDENQRSEHQHSAKLDGQASTRHSKHHNQDMSGHGKGPMVEGSQVSSASSPSVFHMFRLPAFLSSIPSLSLPSLMVQEFPSSMLNSGRPTKRGPLAPPSSILSMSNPAPADREPRGMSENHNVINLSRRQLHHICHEGLQQPVKCDLEGGAPVVQNKDKIVSVLGDSSSDKHTNSKDSPLLPPLRQFSRSHKGYEDNRFSESSVSLPDMFTTVSTSSTSSPSSFTSALPNFRGHSLGDRTRPGLHKSKSWWENIWSGSNSPNSDLCRGKAVKEPSSQESSVHDMD